MKYANDIGKEMSSSYKERKAGDIISRMTEEEFSNFIEIGIRLAKDKSKNKK